MSTQTSVTNGGKPLAGRVAIVTGSTSGIGLGIARALADAGADVVINGLGAAEAIEASVTAFLCSEYARSITGVALPVDGGWTSQ